MRAGVGRACAEVAHRILEEWLLEVSLDIFEQTIFVALAVPHFAKDFSILGYDALDCIVRAVRIVRRLHRDLIGERVYVLEGHLAVGEQLAGTIWEICLLMSFLNRVGESLVTIPRWP